MICRITIDMDNDAFQHNGQRDTCQHELSEILADLSGQLYGKMDTPFESIVLYDSNGNRVGQLNFERE